MTSRPKAQHLSVIAMVALLTATVAACGGSNAPSRGAGAPAGEVKTTKPQRPSSSAKTPRPTPSAAKTTTRPWKITLEKDDSCRIARAIPPGRFKSSQGKIDPTGSLAFSGNVSCSRLSGQRASDVSWDDPGILLEVTAVVDRGLDDALASVNTEGLIDRRLTVDGFAALVVKSPPPGRQCNGFLDVAEGQFVHVMLGQPFGTPDDEMAVPQATLCKTVPRVLSAVLEQLEPTG